MKFELAGLGALIVFFAAFSPAHAQWNFQIVDAAGSWSQIVVTSDGTPYILYYGSPYKVYLSWPVKPGGFWTRRSIAVAYSGYSPEIICDSSDNLHLAYSQDYGIYYAIFSSQAKDWILPPEKVTTEEGNLDLAIAEDAGIMTPAIAYASGGSTQKVATRNPSSGAWSSETLYTMSQYYYYTTSIAADSTGHFHISFFDGTGLNLMYATNAPDGVWGTQVVDVAGDVGRYSSIVIDADGYPCIAYYDATNGDLKYAKMVAH